MATVIINTDTLVQVYTSAIRGSGIGTLSRYASTPHPGTNNEIDGFLWDARSWPNNKELQAVSYAPSIWDPSQDFIASEEFQSGIGDNNDLLLISIDKAQSENKEYWFPKVEHGYFYVQDEEWYLFSDDYQAELFNTDQTYSGLQYVDAKYKLKPGIPVQVKRYVYDIASGKYSIDLSLRKKVEFTGIKVDGEEQSTLTEDDIVILSNIDTSKEEFMVTNHFGSPPRILLNKDYSDRVGDVLDLTPSGSIISGSLEALEILGVSDGIATQYHTKYSPIDPSGEVKVYSWLHTDEIYEWTRIDSVSDFSFGPVREYKLDLSLGIVNFGTYTDLEISGAGLTPQAGTTMGITYPKGLQVEYEPIGSRDYVLATTADVNPLHNATEKGFIKLATEIVDAASIELSTDLTQQTDETYLIDAGNTTGEIIATVRDSEGDVIEGIEVFFEVIDPIVGTFTNGETLTSSISNTNGEAIAFYAPPVSVDSFGYATTDVVYDGGLDRTTITVEGLSAPETTSGVFLFKVMKEDPVLGIPEDGIDDFYSDFFTDEEIADTTATTDYEDDRRITNSLLRPTLYSASDITTGAKVILFSIDNGVIDSHTGDQVPGYIYAPIVPIYASNIGTGTAPITELVYDGEIPAPDGGTDFKSYFTVGEAVTHIRAYVINRRNLKKIYSNTIVISIQIPDNANGVLIAESLADIQEGLFNRVVNVDELTEADIATVSGLLYDEWQADKYPSDESYVDWFIRTRRADSEILGLIDYTFSGDVPARIPFGFKLKDSGITVASLLDSVTFLDINDVLPSGYI